ncbi:carnitine O-acetyltransferase [Malassezia yamatoensis]|uniref:Carnitine O-acetyltransferase n=1 Tax=Malassezia yamatoensis TaxID=253288 RepID=A0AAJ5YVU9_9BASI|nr:carnitine O-acetyltransferase [Malassezia yamatoensis]
MTSTEKITFARQSELPKLPVPSLEDSCKKFLISVEPLQTPEQHQQTKQVVDRFLKNEGPQMQSDLLKYAETQNSYIEEFWDESYLLGNDSVVLNLNPFFILEDEPDPERGTQLRRAANLTLASLCFIHDLRQEILEPDLFRGTPLDMYQYNRLFGLARIPTAHGCKQRLFPDSRHIVVMRKGQFYWFEALDHNHQPLFSETGLIATFRAIVRDADQVASDKHSPATLGVLSTEKRRTWYSLRSELENQAENRRNLNMIDSALFVLCLDDHSPTDVTDLTNNFLCGTYNLKDGKQVGTCLNRWYDKLQIIVCKTGAAGVNFEHSSADGHTVLRFVGDIYTELILQFARSINPNTKSLFRAKTSPYVRGLANRNKTQPVNESLMKDIQARTTPKRLEWILDSSMLQSIQHAEMRLSDLICQNECFVLEFKGYGKRFITNHGFSPDAFVQMAFQAAYYSLYGRAVPSYEPAMTKAFLRGRTETIRTVQPHTMNFVKTWTDPDATVQSKLETLRAACVGHAKLSKAAASGQGFDRAFKAANIHQEQTYIDLNGNECDVRTGLPIRSSISPQDQNQSSKGLNYGTSGYSFYGDGAEADTESDNYIEYNPRESVGKMVFVSEYE